jgi:hypothetical protein
VKCATLGLREEAREASVKCEIPNPPPLIKHTLRIQNKAHTAHLSHVSSPEEVTLLQQVLGLTKPELIRKSRHQLPLPHSLADKRLEWMSIGIDVSIYLRAALRLPGTTLQALIVPWVHVLGIRTALSKLIALLTKKTKSHRSGFWMNRY